MSFSSDVKKELCLISCEENYCCQRAEAYGMLYFGRAFGKTEISLMTDYDFIAERYKLAIYNLIQSEPSIVRSRSGKLTITVDSAYDRMDILNELGYSGNEPSTRLITTNIENECCFGAFLRGAFLACGIITDPKIEYHLEFNVGYRSKGKYFSELFNEFSAVPKQSERNGVNMIYFKDSSHIEDILTVMGAQQSVMEFIGEKILKDVRNNVNRKVNCDNANIRKTCEAARAQITAIESIINSGKFDELPPDIKEIANLRLSNPEMTLTELGENLSEPMSRSGVNRRLKKLIELGNL